MSETEAKLVAIIWLLIALPFIWLLFRRSLRRTN